MEEALHDSEFKGQTTSDVIPPWSEGDVGAAERAMVARGHGYLFGLGGLLLLGTVLLSDRSEHVTELVVLATIASATAVGLLTKGGSLPLSLLHLSPALGTVLVALVIRYSGPAESGVYAIYVAWVLVGAALFLDSRLVLAHGSFAFVASLWAVLTNGSNEPSAALIGAMIGGTVIATTLVIRALDGHIRGVVDRLERDARTDALTGLPNRRAFDEAFAREVQRSRRTESPAAVVLIDIDRFKRYNDDRGHPSGDRALQRIGRVLLDRTRASDIVTRIGGEEFAVLAPDSGAGGALALAERVRRAVEVEFGAGEGLTASCGVASTPEHGVAVTELLAAADAALYEAKRHGRNRAVAASEADPRLSTASVDVG